jgi:aspartate beta-hydroxylase
LLPVTPMPTTAVRLDVAYDHEELRTELRALQASLWSPQSSYRDGVGEHAEIDWRVLPLRSPGGKVDRTDPGGPGLDEFADTSAKRVAHAASRLLDAIPSPKRAVRYMALGPGAASNVHSDTKCGPRWGVARIHAPVTTNDGAVLRLDGAEYHWQPGELWFGDFSRPHMVANLGSEVRVHLVIDILTTDRTADIFPDEWRPYFDSGDVIINREPEPRPGLAGDWACHLSLPMGFLSGAGHTDPVWRETVRAEVSPLPDDGLALVADTGQRMRLIHVRAGEFRYAGWSEERTIVLPAGGQPAAVMVRDGRRVFSVSVAVQP